MSSKKSNPALTMLLLGILFVFIGGGATGLSLIFGADAVESKQIFDIVMYVGIGFAVFGVILIIAGIASGKRRKAPKAAQPNEQTPVIERVDDKIIEPTFVFEPQTYEFVTVGRRQSNDEKFNEIGKMGKTQFVIYMCKLFSLNGYEVTYTPVAENHDIDLLIKRDGVTRVVGCLLANKVMCAEDIKSIYAGKDFYQADGVMVVTNMYFDRTALDFAKSRKITLVDRNILIEKYMR